MNLAFKQQKQYTPDRRVVYQILNKHIIKIREQICMPLEEHTELMENMRNVNSFQLGILNGRCHVEN